MLDVMTRAETKYGPDYYVVCKGGIHASDHGQFVMSYAFLKAIGLDDSAGVMVEAGASCGYDFSTTLDQPNPDSGRRLWCPEDPFIYNVHIELNDPEGRWWFPLLGSWFGSQPKPITFYRFNSSRWDGCVNNSGRFTHSTDSSARRATFCLKQLQSFSVMIW